MLLLLLFLLYVNMNMVIYFYYYCRETEPGWEKEIEEEVGGECSKYGKILNIVVANNTKVCIMFIIQYFINISYC